MAHASRCVVRAILFLIWSGWALGADRPLFDTSLRTDLLTPEEKRWLAAHPVIRVAASSSYPPVEYFDKPGVFWGITSEYFNLMELRLGYRFKFIQLSQDAWQLLDPRERGADVITASAETPNRAQFWSYTRPYLVFPTYILTRRGADDGLTLAHFAQARVAVVQGWAAEEYLRTQFPEVIVDAVPDTATGLRKVSFGLVDAFVSELPVATATMEKEGIANLKIAGEAGYSYVLGISVRKDWPELVAILEKALATVTPKEREEIYKRWVKIQAPLPNERVKHLALWSGVGLLAILASVVAWNRTLSSRVRAITAEVRAELARRIAADEALLASEEKFAKAFHASPVPISLSTVPEGVFLDINPAFTAAFGYTREDCLGRTTGDVDIYFQPQDRQRVRESLLADGGVRNWELAVRHKDGGERVVLLSCQRLSLVKGHCVISLAQDITERKRAEEALRLSDEKFERAFRNSPDAIIITSVPDGRIVEINEGVCRLSGFARGEIIGRTTAELSLWCSAAVRERYLEILRECGRVVDLEAEFCMKDGQTRLGLISGEVIELHEGPHVIATVRDITERKRAETERQRLNAQLLQSEDEERRRIARELHDTTAQHLAVIQMNLTRLREAAPANTDTQLLAESLSLTAQSVQEIRTLSYLLHPPLLDELGLAGALGDYAAGFAKRSGIHVEVDTAGYSGHLPREQEMALFRVAQESLTNVRRHSGSASVLIRLERDADEVRLEVQDSGRGLPPGTLHGVGLRGMRERLSRIGGELNIDSDAEGTTVLAAVPVGKIPTIEN